LGRKTIGQQMKKRAAFFPLTYLIVCEALTLLYELGLAHKAMAMPGIYAVLLLVVLTSPAASIGTTVKLFVAARMGCVEGDAICLNSFWPRIISVQSEIIACTAVILLAVVVVRLIIRSIGPTSRSTGRS
jgi:hypothetical protein